MTSEPTAAASRITPGPVITGICWGLLTGATPFFQPISANAQFALGIGLGLSYASVGVLVAFLVRAGQNRRWLRGGLIGLLYSVPGAVFTMVPYPLREDAPRYWHEFAAGGLRAFCLTLVFGGVVGLTCGVAVRASRA